MSDSEEQRFLRACQKFTDDAYGMVDPMFSGSVEGASLDDPNHIAELVVSGADHRDIHLMGGPDYMALFTFETPEGAPPKAVAIMKVGNKWFVGDGHIRDGADASTLSHNCKGRIISVVIKDGNGKELARTSDETIASAGTREDPDADKASRRHNYGRGFAEVNRGGDRARRERRGGGLGDDDGAPEWRR